jgi:hypothetical protein
VSPGRDHPLRFGARDGQQPRAAKRYAGKPRDESYQNVTHLSGRAWAAQNKAGRVLASQPDERTVTVSADRVRTERAGRC